VIYKGCEHPTALWLEYSSLKASNVLTTDETTTLRRELFGSSTETEQPVAQVNHPDLSMA
jgi:hypothetical protein